MTEHLPVGWSIKPLGDLAQVVGGGTPSRTVPSFWDDGAIPWATPTDITATHGKYISGSKDRITKVGLMSCSASLLPPGSILMTSRATLGEAKISTMPACTNQGFKSLVANKGVSNEFLYYQVQRTKQEYARHGSGSTFLEVGKKDTIAFPVLIPEEASQTKIAEVLSLIDTQIEATEALIAKQEQVRAGLMQDLFMRGVDEHGQLRPPREEAPHLYHQTELGWLPTGWGVLPAHKLCSSVIDCKNRTPPITSEGHPVFRTPNVRNGKFVTDGLVHTDPASHREWTRRGQPLPGDILITREAPVGEVCIIPSEFALGCLGQRMMLYRPLPDIISCEFMLYALQSQLVQGHLDRISGGSTVGHVKVGDVRDLAIPFCREPEQGLVATALVVKDAVLDGLRQFVAKLLSQKSGLMQDLLTGKVSVASLFEGVAA